MIFLKYLDMCLYYRLMGSEIVNINTQVIVLEGKFDSIYFNFKILMNVLILFQFQSITSNYLKLKFKL